MPGGRDGTALKLRGVKAGKPMKLITDENGRTRAVVDQKKIEARKPVCARGKKRVTVVKRGGK